MQCSERLAMDSMQHNLRSQPAEHAYCRMSGMQITPPYLTFQRDLDKYMKRKKQNCTVHLSLKKGMELIGPPQEISKAYNIAQAFLCMRMNRPKVQLLRTTTTTNDYYHELRATTTTNYDYDEIRLRRNTITTTPVGGSPPSDLCEHYY